MNRRGFLKMLAGAGVVAATNPVHFIAPIGGWKSDVIINPIADIAQYADWINMDDLYESVPELDQLIAELSYRAVLSVTTLRFQSLDKPGDRFQVLESVERRPVLL